MAEQSHSDSEKRQHRLGELVIAIGALTSLIATVREFLDAAGDASNAFRSAGLWTGVAVGVALIFVGLYVRFRKASRLLKIDALRIDSDNPKHLIGRGEKIDQLEHLCRDSYLVHLVGESGAGKSALVRSGFVPKLREDESLLPVYMDTWGQDWEHGPRTALMAALWTTLTEEDRGKLKLETRPEPDQLSDLLKRLQSELGRTPLLIFDQFDDYQSRHRARFIVSKRHTVLTTADLL